jgi:hypothetical protein
MDLQTIRIFGMCHEQSMLLLEMLPSTSPHLHVEFELFPLDQKSDYRLHMDIEPLKIIYDAVSNRKRFFPKMFLYLIANN